MIRDLERELPGVDEPAEICVVGAGAAGIVLAVKLAHLGHQVTLLEGGGQEIADVEQDVYRSELTGLPHRGIHSGRFRAHGGTTNKWGGQILELDTIDFESRPWIPGSGWPFPKSELAPHYARALELEGMSGVELSDPAIWRELKLAQPKFNALTQYFTRWTPQPNFAILHRRMLEGPQLSVWLHANAISVDMDSATGKFRAVNVRTLSGRNAIFRAKHFVFCLGAIESSRFFLQAREGALPWNRSGLLGLHFQDHIDANAADLTISDPPRFHEAFDNVFLHGFKYHPKLKLRDQVQRDAQTLNAGATMYFLSSLDEQLAALKTTAKNVLRGQLGNISSQDLRNVLANLPLLARQTWRYKLNHRVWNPPSATVKLRVHCEQEPLSASSISLSSERDALGLLRTRLGWRISALELRTIREIALLAQREMSALAELTPDPALLELDPAFLTRCDDSNHHMGGMRMAVSEAEGVVSPELRLFGTPNAYVCSGAVFPTSGFSNPTHTVLALAARLAQHLHEQS